MKRPKSKQARSKATTVSADTSQIEVKEQKGDLLIRDLWQNVTDSFHDMHVVNTYAKYHLAKTPEKCLQESERANKKIYLKACLQQRRHFSIFIASIDGLMGEEATSTLKRIASRLETKWRQTYSRMCGYIKSRATITLVRSTHPCIRGFRVTVHKISVHIPKREDGAALNLFR